MSLKLLKQLDMQRKREQHPNFPAHAIPETKFTDQNANGLTRCIIAWIQLNGGQAERISTTGRYIDNRKITTDVLGRTRIIGSGKWIPGTSTKGSSDISSTIPVIINGKKVGISVKWEVKIGKDRQSEDQKNYQMQIESSSGYYFIVRSFDDFYEKYNNLLNKFAIS